MLLVSLEITRPMPGPELIAAAKQTIVHSVWRWIFHLGALGFIPLGLLDSSLVPVPGSMDVLTIVLASRTDQWEWRFYYVVLATFGSVLGAYLTYRLARKGGEKTLEERISRQRLRQVRELFQKWGFAAIALPALLPPPIPLVPFVLVAGAMKYSVKRFLAAMALGRLLRYTILVILAAFYGREILRFFTSHKFWMAGGVVCVAVAAWTAYLLFRKTKTTKGRSASARA
jgi:membrane protein DedA with SNARE-associated domain